MRRTTEFKVSVVMAIYNVEAYLEDAINSIIEQTIGFKENIQLILVNDGSPDNAASICRRYEQLYPENIIYIEKENGGVSSARNRGMEIASGKYVNFFDADDKWDKNAFSILYDFFEKHYNEIDVVSARYYFFGKKEGYIHPLDYKFTKSQVVNIDEKYDYIQMSVATAFIKRQSLNELKFDTRLKFSEDSVFITKIIMQKKQYGIISGAIYFYRKRFSNDSALDFSAMNKSWYFDTPQYCYKAIFQYAKDAYGKILPYAQYLVMYDLQWRIKMPIPENFLPEEQQTYKKAIIELLKNIDDRIICGQKNLNFAYKIYALNLKYGKNILSESTLKKSCMVHDGVRVFDLKASDRFRINISEVRGNMLYLSGETQFGSLGDRCKLFIEDEKKQRYPIKLFELPHSRLKGLMGENIYCRTGYETELPIYGGKKFSFFAERDNEKIKLKPTFEFFAKLDSYQYCTYFAEGQYIIKYINNKVVCVDRTKRTHLAAEFRYIKGLLKKRKISCVCYRLCYHAIQRFYKTPIWIVSDRTNYAGDNGAAFFQYLNTEAEAQANIYFALSKNNDSFNKMKKVGKVLAIESFKYRLYFLMADKIISSQADMWVQNAFGEEKCYFQDLYTFDFIFLQHGIIQSNLASWLYKQNKNIKLFITSTEAEQRDILTGGYGYSRKEVKLLGLPRYDYLNSIAKRKILFMPTWRQHLAGEMLRTEGKRDYSENFKESQYLSFFNCLINDSHLLKKMKDYGYTGEFYLHPAFEQQWKDFKGNDIICVKKGLADYSKSFEEGALLITDYSSVAFDFAYLKKPIVYCQFDKEVFYKEHIGEKSYFDYETEGFGPVCYENHSTVNQIIQLMERNCEMDSCYKKRVEDFFAFQDKKNCERVYNAIMQME